MQPIENHDDIPLTAPPISNEIRGWFAVYTASNHEKRVAQHLRVKEIETFLPLYSATKRWKNRTTVKVELPLFSGYVFALTSGRFSRFRAALLAGDRYPRRK
jgi:hypothetical protein